MDHPWAGNKHVALAYTQWLAEKLKWLGESYPPTEAKQPCSQGSARQTSVEHIKKIWEEERIQLKPVEADSKQLKVLQLSPYKWRDWR